MKLTPMTGSEIARTLGMSRQNVSQTLIKAMRKIYNGLLEEYETPWKTANAMMQVLGVSNSTPQDIEEFFQLLPTDIREEVKKDAASIYKLQTNV